MCFLKLIWFIFTATGAVLENETETKVKNRFLVNLNFYLFISILRKRYDGRNYTILSGKDSDGSGDETELQLKKSRFKEVPTVEKIVEEGDTLQALALRYGITVCI